MVVLRGQRYTAAKPVTFADLKAQQTEPLTAWPEHASPLIGFRIAVKAP